MVIPSHDDIMLPLLELVEGGVELTIQEAVTSLVATLEVTGEELMKFAPNGKYSEFSTRVRKAISDLVDVGLLERTEVETLKITELGVECLEKLQ